MAMYSVPRESVGNTRKASLVKSFMLAPCTLKSPVETTCIPDKNIILKKRPTGLMLNCETSNATVYRLSLFNYFRRYHNMPT